MDSRRGVLSFDAPVYWNEILAFAKVGGGVETDAWRKARLALPLEHCRAALNDLIEKIQFRNCRVNESFLRALHLSRLRSRSATARYECFPSKIYANSLALESDP